MDRLEIAVNRGRKGEGEEEESEIEKNDRGEEVFIVEGKVVML